MTISPQAQKAAEEIGVAAGMSVEQFQSCKSSKQRKEIETIIQHAINEATKELQEQIVERDKEIERWSSLLHERTEQLTELQLDKERLDWLHKEHFSILATCNPRTFMITSMGRPSGTNNNLRTAIDSAMEQQKAEVK